MPGDSSLIPLVISVYAIFLPGLGIEKELNERRDKVLDAGSTYSVEHRRLIYENDWLTIFLSYVWYQVCLLIFLIVMASTLRGTGSAVFGYSSALAIFGFI